MLIFDFQVIKMNYLIDQMNNVSFHNKRPQNITKIINKIYGNKEWDIYTACGFKFISGVMNKHLLQLLCPNHIINSSNDIYNVNIRIYNFLYEISYDFVDNKNGRQYYILNFIDLSNDEKLIYNYLRDLYYTDCNKYL